MQASTAIAEYLLWLRSAKDPSPHTLRAYASDLGRWYHYLATDRAVADLTNDDLVDFVHAQRTARLSNRTIARRLAALRGFYAWLVERDLTPADTWNFGDVRPGRQRSLPRTAKGDDLLRLHNHLRRQLCQT